MPSRKVARTIRFSNVYPSRVAVGIYSFAEAKRSRKTEICEIRVNLTPLNSTFIAFLIRQLVDRMLSSPA